MKKTMKTPKQICMYLFMLFVSINFAQESKSSSNLFPESVFGEWRGNPESGGYNALLIHKDFIEFGYRAFMYQNIHKNEQGVFIFAAKDMLGNTINYQLNVIDRDTIKLKKDSNAFITLVKQENPTQAKRVTLAEVPNVIKKNWYTTDGKNNLEFSFKNKTIIFRNKTYSIEDLVHFRPNETGEYRFVVKNENDYYMFYFKNWQEDYIQVGFNGTYGDLYKASKKHPNIPIKNFSKYAASKNGKRYLSNEKEAKRVPKNVSKWIKSELAKVTTKPLEDYNSAAFFNRANARLIGYLKGYDVSLGFSTAIIYVKNDITREDTPIVVKIHPDGKFEANLPLFAPTYNYILLENRWIPFYLEPAQTLSLTIDLFEVFQSDRMALIENRFKNIEYQGPLATENLELLGYNFKMQDFNVLRNNLKTLAPKDFKKEQNLFLKENLQAIEDYKNNATVFKKTTQLDGKERITETSISPKVTSVLKNTVLLRNAEIMLNYASDRKHEARKDTTNAILKLPIPNDYYDFLKKMPLDDKSILVAKDFGSFINRFEFMEPLLIYPKSKSVVIKPEKSLLEYIEEEEIAISNEEKMLLMDRSKNSDEENKLFYEKNKENFKKFNEKYKADLQAYSDKYYKPLIEAMKNKSQKVTMEKWQLRDSVLTNVLGLEKSLAYEIIKIRALKYDIERSNSEDANAYWKLLKQDISHPFLVQEGSRMLKKIFPENEKLAYALPKGRATNVFNKIVQPYKGKVVFVDFWATWCGPCIGSIKRMKDIRKKYKDNKDFVFVFITDHSSPLPRYNSFIKEQELENVYRLSDDDYKYLRELFKFNGIPRYVVINKNGDVINDDFEMYNFESELSGILKQSK